MKTFSTKPKNSETSQEIVCPLCEFSKYRSLWKLDGYNFSKCPQCGLVYQNPQPRSEEVIERYDDSYFSYEIENEDTFLNLMLLGLNDIGFSAEVIKKGGKVLDIGCATGLFLEYMKKNGWQTFGVEVCSRAAAYGNKHREVNIFTGILNDAPLQENSMDIIHLSHVIEHITDPDTFVKLIYKYLKPGGFVYCVTPNIDGLQAKLFKSLWRSAIPDHMILFSYKTLKKIFISTPSSLRELK